MGAFPPYPKYDTNSGHNPTLYLRRYRARYEPAHPHARRSRSNQPLLTSGLPLTHKNTQLHTFTGSKNKVARQYLHLTRTTWKIKLRNINSRANKETFRKVDNLILIVRIVQSEDIKSSLLERKPITAHRKLPEIFSVRHSNAIQIRPIRLSILRQRGKNLYCRSIHTSKYGLTILNKAQNTLVFKAKFPRARRLSRNHSFPSSTSQQAVYFIHHHI